MSSLVFDKGIQQAQVAVRSIDARSFQAGIPASQDNVGGAGIWAPGFSLFIASILDWRAPLLAPAW